MPNGSAPQPCRKRFCFFERLNFSVRYAASVRRAKTFSVPHNVNAPTCAPAFNDAADFYEFHKIPFALRWLFPPASILYHFPVLSAPSGAKLVCAQAGDGSCRFPAGSTRQPQRQRETVEQVLHACVLSSRLNRASFFAAYFLAVSGVLYHPIVNQYDQSLIDSLSNPCISATAR